MNKDNRNLEEIRFSVLDLVTVAEESTAREAMRRSVELAQKTEELGFKRFWISEHHNLRFVKNPFFDSGLSPETKEK